MYSMYSSNAETLRDRIVALIPSNPKILELDNPFGLFKVPDLTINDLDLTLYQASWALGAAKQKWQEELQCSHM